MLIKYQRTYMSGERFLLIIANFYFFIVYLGSHVTPKKDTEKKGWKEVFEARIDLKVEHEIGNGGMSRDNGGVSARKRAGKEGKKG